MTPYFKEQLGCEGSMSQHDTLTLEPCPFCGRHVEHVSRADNHSATGKTYIVSCFCGGYSACAHQQEDTLEEVVAAWNRRAALSATQPAQAKQSDWSAQRFNAPVYPPDGTESPFTVINLGSGKVQMGDSIHDGRLPALWFGINGQGMGHEETMNREAHPGETLAVVTFANVEGLDVLLDVIQRIRRENFPEAQAAQSEPAEHWHRLYLEKCQQYNDRVSQLGGVIEGLEAEAAQGAGEVVELPPLPAPETMVDGYGAMKFHRHSALVRWYGVARAALSARKPLNSAQIRGMAIQEEFLLVCDSLEDLTCIVREVERAHGIGLEVKP